MQIEPTTYVSKNGRKCKDYNLDAEAVRLLASRTRKKVNKAKLVTLAEALEWHTTANNFHLVRAAGPPFDKKPNTKLTFGATVRK